MCSDCLRTVLHEFVAELRCSTCTCTITSLRTIQDTKQFCKPPPVERRRYIFFHFCFCGLGRRDFLCTCAICSFILRALLDYVMFLYTYVNGTTTCFELPLQTYETSPYDVHRRETLNTSAEGGSEGWMVSGPKCVDFRTLWLLVTVHQTPTEALFNYMGVVLKTGYKIHEVQKKTRRWQKKQKPGVWRLGSNPLLRDSGL